MVTFEPVAFRLSDNPRARLHVRARELAEDAARSRSKDYQLQLLHARHDNNE